MSSPRSSAQLVLLSILGVGVAAFAWWLIAGQAQSDPNPSGMGTAGSPADVTPANAVGDSSASTNVSEAVDSDVPAIAVRWRALGRYRPAPPPTFDVSYAGVPVPGVATRVLAGAGADPFQRTANEPARGSALVELSLPNFGSLGASTACRVVWIAEDAGPAVVALGPVVICRGQVLQGEEGLPLAGAIVRIPSRSNAAASSAVTDADGRFELADVLSGEGVPLVVSAAGFATAGRVVALGEDGEIREPFELRSAAPLVIRAVGDVAAARGVRVSVQPSGNQSTLDQQVPWFLQCFDPPVLLGADGTVTIKSLPPGVQVQVVACGPFAHAVSQPVRLRTSGKKSVAELKLKRVKHEMCGHLVDARGDLVAGGFVRGPGVRAVDARGVLLPPEVLWSGGTVVRTGADGSFCIGLQSDGPPQLSIARLEGDVVLELLEAKELGAIPLPGRAVSRPEVEFGVPEHLDGAWDFGVMPHNEPTSAAAFQRWDGAGAAPRFPWPHAGWFELQAQLLPVQRKPDVWAAMVFQQVDVIELPQTIWGER